MLARIDRTARGAADQRALTLGRFSKTAPPPELAGG